MREFRYSFSSLLPHYLRAGGGFIIALAVILFASDTSVTIWIVGPIALLFLAFGCATVLKQMTVLQTSTEGLARLGPFNRSIRWQELQRFELRYYSIKRDRSDGWMQMTIRGKGRSISVESTIEGFSDLVAIASAAAETQGVGLSEASQTNLEALGL